MQLRDIFALALATSTEKILLMLQASIIRQAELPTRQDEKRVRQRAWSSKGVLAAHVEEAFEACRSRTSAPLNKFNTNSKPSKYKKRGDIRYACGE